MSLKSTTKVDINTTELLFTVDAEAFSAAVEKVFQRQKKNITVPGFRKGKANRKLIEKYLDAHERDQILLDLIGYG